MRRKYRFLAVAISFILFAMVVGCSNKPFSEDEAMSLLDEISLMALENGNIREIEKRIDEGINRLGKDQASDAVNALLYAMHQKTPDFNAKMSGLQEVMFNYEDKSIDFNNPKSIEQIEDGTLKAFLQEVQDNYFVITKEAGIYLANPNVAYVLNKYKPYMKDDLRAWAEFINKEYQQSIFDEEKQQFDLDLVANRIFELEEYIEKFAESNFASGFKNAKSYYYQIYFGMNHEYMVDSNKVVLDEVIKHYKKTIETHPESQLAKDLKVYIEKLEQEGNQMTDNVYAFLADLTQIEMTSDEGQVVESGVNSSIKEAIKEAIKENEKTQ